MPSYKVLKSVAHNLGHSFLSDMNTVDQFKSFIAEVLLDIAEDRSEPKVEIDLLAGTITPAAFRRSDIEESVRLYHRMLRRLVDDQGAAWSMVKAARLKLGFDLTTLRRADGSRRERPEFA